MGIKEKNFLNICDIFTCLEQIDCSLDLIIDSFDDEIRGMANLPGAGANSLNRLQIPLEALRLVSGRVYDLLQDCDTLQENM